MASADDRELQLTREVMAHFERSGVSRRNFLKMLGLAGGGAALGSLLAACGGSPAIPAAGNAPAVTVPPAGTTAPAGAATSAATTAAAGGIGAAQVLVLASGQDISNIDPHTGHDYSIASAQKAVYDTLLRYKNSPPVIEKLLATDYSANENATEWTFKLDPRAVFHDGTPVKASDVVYSVGRLLRKNKGAAWMFVNVMNDKSAVAVDDHTVKFTLTAPFAPLPLVLPWLFIVNEKVAKEHDKAGDDGEAWFLDHEAGSGPFTIKNWKVGDSYEFAAVPNYWAGWSSAGHAAGFVWKIARESSSTRLGLLNGDFHMAFDMSAEDSTALAKTAGIHTNTQPGLGVCAIKMNNQRGPMADVHVRKAVSYAMDYDAVIAALNGAATLLNGPLPSMGDFNNPALVPYRYNLEKAKAELAQSKYPKGGFTVEYVYVTGLQIEEQIGLILLDKLSQLSITVKLVPLVWPDMVARASKVETAADMMAVYSGTDYADPDNFLWQAYHSSQAGFWAAASHYKNPQLDALLVQARSTADAVARVKIYHQAQQVMVDDAADVWLQSEITRVAWSDKLGGYTYCPIMGYYVQPMYLKA
ncbi:MAG: ABC transporter substrate-binding protein [Herpetosiphon sp.]